MRVSGHTLEQWRRSGLGPAAVEHASAPMYALAAVQEFLAAERGEESA